MVDGFHGRSTGCRAFVSNTQRAGSLTAGFCKANAESDFNREGLGIEVDFSLPAERVVRSLNQIIEWRGKPDAIRVDNVLYSE
jgi:transposase InsO family protein